MCTIEHFDIVCFRNLQHKIVKSTRILCHSSITCQYFLLIPKFTPPIYNIVIITLLLNTFFLIIIYRGFCYKFQFIKILNENFNNKFLLYTFLRNHQLHIRGYF